LGETKLGETKSKSGMIWTVAAFILAALFVLVAVQTYREQASGMSFPESRLEIRRADGSKAAFRIEVAATPEQQEHGLMFRKQLAADAGMLFLWDEDQPISMWMKNTLIPLDMLFVAPDGRIARIAANAVPLDLTPISSNGNIRAVIEIGGGEAAKQRIREGDEVLYKAFTEKP
jgi:uncharacterized membrane protein (UPF0127 family)